MAALGKSGPSGHSRIYCSRKWKRDGGQRFVATLRSKCANLASLRATLGTTRPELRPDIRSFPFRGYGIFFRYREDLFEVVNIIEGHRDFDKFFGGKSGIEMDSSES